MSDRNAFSLLPIGADDPEGPKLSPAMQQCALNLYRQAWEDYRKIDCPYGETDEAMLVWYVLHGDSPGPDLVTGRN
jgi:hypothetical protein